METKGQKILKNFKQETEAEGGEQMADGGKQRRACVRDGLGGQNWGSPPFRAQHCRLWVPLNPRAGPGMGAQVSSPLLSVGQSLPPFCAQSPHMSATGWLWPRRAPETRWGAGAVHGFSAEIWTEAEGKFLSPDSSQGRMAWSLPPTGVHSAKWSQCKCFPIKHGQLPGS